MDAFPQDRTRRTKLLCRLVVLLVAVAGCTEQVHEPPPPPPSPAMAPDTARVVRSPLDTLFAAYDPYFEPLDSDSVAAEHWVDSVLSSLTLDQKIGQLFIVHLPTPDLRRVFDDDALEAVNKRGVGGFLVPRLLEPRAVFDETQRLQQAADIPLFFAADYERGVGRFSNALTELPSNMALGATRDTVLAAAAGRLTAIESRALGVNLLLAPVVDVNNNPDNPIINIRSYGEDPELVGRMAAAFVREAQRYGVLTTLKHFPGHGNTTVDSHARLGAVPSDPAELDSVELRPYRIVLSGSHAASGVMSTHLWVQALNPEPVPATFSRRALGGLLRDSLGFDGFIVTDDIEMGALTNDYSINVRVVRPLQAGADLILTPADLEDAVGAVKAAVQRGDLTEARIDESVRRILRAKTQAGLHHRRPGEARELAWLMEAPQGAGLAQAIADRAVTLLKSSPVLPLADERQLALVQIVNFPGSESVQAAMDTLAARLQPAADVHLLPQSSQARRDAAVQAADTADVVVVALYQRLMAGRGEAGLHPEQERLVREVLAAEAPVVLVTFGNPYAVAAFPEAAAVLVAYEQALESVEAVVDVMEGRLRPQGRLPITVAPYDYGSGGAEPDRR